VGCRAGARLQIGEGSVKTLFISLIVHTAGQMDGLGACEAITADIRGPHGSGVEATVKGRRSSLGSA
jgi:hypothetical protein